MFPNDQKDYTSIKRITNCGIWPNGKTMFASFKKVFSAGLMRP